MIDVVGNRGYAEWVVTAKQTSDLVLDDDVLTEIIETPITLRGVTIARFVGNRIAELRRSGSPRRVSASAKPRGALPPEAFACRRSSIPAPEADRPARASRWRSA